MVAISQAQARVREAEALAEQAGAALGPTITNRRTVADLETCAFTLDVTLIRALGSGYRA